MHVLSAYATLGLAIAGGCLLVVAGWFWPFG